MLVSNVKHVGALNCWIVNYLAVYHLYHVAITNCVIP